MTRWEAIKLFLLCSLVTPLLWVAFGYQALLGNTQRTENIAIAYDIYGNDSMGGPIGTTVSATVGNALYLGKPWGIRCAAIIDSVMGAGHCLSKATNKYVAL